MENLMIPLADDLKKIIEKHKEIEWIKIAQDALWDRARKLELLDKLTQNSKLTEKEAIEIGNKIKTEIAKKHGF